MASIKGVDCWKICWVTWWFFFLKLCHKCTFSNDDFLSQTLKNNVTFVLYNYYSLRIVSSFYFCFISIFIEKTGCFYNRFFFSNDDATYNLSYGPKTNHYLLLLQVSTIHTNIQWIYNLKFNWNHCTKNDNNAVLTSESPKRIVTTV